MRQQLGAIVGHRPGMEGIDADDTFRHAQERPGHLRASPAKTMIRRSRTRSMKTRVFGTAPTIWARDALRLLSTVDTQNGTTSHSSTSERAKPGRPAGVRCSWRRGRGCPARRSRSRRRAVPEIRAARASGHRPRRRSDRRSAPPDAPAPATRGPAPSAVPRAARTAGPRAYPSTAFAPHLRDANARCSIGSLASTRPQNPSISTSSPRFSASRASAIHSTRTRSSAAGTAASSCSRTIHRRPSTSTEGVRPGRLA